MEGPRLFTLEEASALLPAVRALVAGIQEAKGDLDRVTLELGAAVESSGSNGHAGGSKEVVSRERASRLASRLESLVGELQGLGCELKGVEQGLIDFPSMRDGRVVYLCWQPGEDEISYWHELDAGFAGRQPL